MSGPIIRKYGFANFEKIFGERELQHGVEGKPANPPTSQTPAEPSKPPQGTEPTHEGAEKPAP